MKANGDDKTQLTNTRKISDSDPAFSPNGKKIAFWSTRGGNSADIFTMSANGTDQKRVTSSESSEFDPAWSPDGTRIAFTSFRTGGGDIYVINQDGSGLTRLTTSAQRDIEPAWSPDGTRIAFVRGNKIQVMKAARESATNIPQRLTTNRGGSVAELDPAWSPDGTRIAFESDLSSGPANDFELYSIRADGSDQNQLTNSPNGISFDPAWSPNGTKIAFSARRGSDGTPGIYVMKAAPESATNRPERLTGTLVISEDPDWQPLP